MNLDQLLQFDRTHIWHPYTSMTNPLPVYPVQSASGVRIKLMDGRELIDGMSSWWSAIHGYNHPVLTRVVQKQAGTLSHIMFGGLTHEPAVTLSQKLVEISPEPLKRVFLSDSGSVSVEVAMKMAMQYFYSTGRAHKNRFVTIRSGYHGDTFHAMSVCDPETGMHSIYSDVLPSYYFADAPKISFYDQWQDEDIKSLEKLVVNNHKTLCALILEPIVQGAGGMRFYNPQYLKRARELCDQYDVLLICDEIATGLGRTGKMFASEYAGISPDIMCLGKTLTAGYMTLAATLCTTEIGEGLSSGSPGVFMHGPTYMGNPLGCSVAAASIDLLLADNWQDNISRIEKSLRKGLEPCAQCPWVNDVRVLGAIGVVELNRAVDMGVIQKRLVEKGIWLRPFGKLVYIMPPYITGDDELQVISQGVQDILSEERGW